MHIVFCTRCTHINVISREICHLYWAQPRWHYVSSSSQCTQFHCFPRSVRKHSQLDDTGQLTNSDASDRLAAARSRWLHRIVKIKPKENKRFVGTLDLSSTAQKMWSRSLRTTLFYLGDSEKGFYFSSRNCKAVFYSHQMHACVWIRRSDTWSHRCSSKQHANKTIQTKWALKFLQIVCRRWTRERARARALAFAINLCFSSDRRFCYPFHPFSLRSSTTDASDAFISMCLLFLYLFSYSHCDSIRVRIFYIGVLQRHYCCNARIYCWIR